MGRPDSPPVRRTQALERYSDPLGGLSRDRAESSPVATTTQVRSLPAGAAPKRKLVVDPERERAIHEELMGDRDRADWERTRLLFAVSGICALVLSNRLGFDGLETIGAMIACTPFVALAGWLMKQMAGFLPAFNERMACSAIVAIVVGAGAFYIFFEEGTMGRLYEGGHPEARRTR